MIVPLVLPSIRLQNFYDLANQAVHNVARPADDAYHDPSIYERFISGISALKDPDIKLKESLRVLDVPKHLHFVFAAIADSEVILKSMELSGLDHTVVDTKKRNIQLAIISGTVKEFRHAIMVGTSVPELAEMYFEIYRHFEANGFREVFNFREIPQKDNVPKLEQR